MPTLALAGVAHIHIPGFLGTIKKRGLTVKSVFDHDAARAKRRADEMGAKVVADVNAIANDPDVTAVVVCSETDRHQPLVLPLAAAGKHLFVEKPLGIAADDAYAMADAIEKAGVKFSTGYFMRGMGSILTIKKLVDSGFFGQITRVRASNCHSGSLGGWFDGEWRWMADTKQAGVGAFGDLGTHVLDLLLWIFGNAKSVTATLDPVTKRYPGCDETGEGMIVFESGAIGTLAAAWADIANPVSFLVSGTKGHATIIDGKLHLQHAEKKIDVILNDPAEGKASGFDAWLDAIEGKPATLVGAKEAAYRSSVMAAMYRAANERTWVSPK